MVNNTSLKYQGNVEIKLIIKDKVITLEGHNSGLPALQESFCRIMTGGYRGTCDIPQYIDLKYFNTETSTWKTYLTTRVSLSAAAWKWSTIYNNYVAKFTGILNASMLVDSILATSSTQFRLYLYTDPDVADEETAYRDLAYLDVDAASLSRITPGVQALIEWTMQIKD